jgi:uncharacterized damage-inducible protein DinB
MKKLTLYVSIMLLSAFTVQQPALIRDDKSFLLDQLQTAHDRLVNDVSGLSDAQMNFKSAPNRWSISECMEHIIKAEKNMFDQEQEAIKKPATPEKRQDVKITDTALLRMLADRSHKAKAPEALVPQGLYSTASAAVDAFNAQHTQVIDYVKNTNDDLRNHIIASPIGTMDTYQLLLLLAGHTTRHTMQIEEVMADPAFPRSN